MLSLCAPHFLEDVRAQSTGDFERSKEILGNYLNLLAALKRSYSGRLFEARHPGVLVWPELVPETIRNLTFSRQAQASLHQLTSG